jgi:transcriptional regulator with XRE-family HTH domain
MKWFERLRQAREVKGYKKAHFAKAIGVKPPTNTEWERGDTVAPSAANVMKICQVLNITPEWLMQSPGSASTELPMTTRTYWGNNPAIEEAVQLMEKMQDFELTQALAIIKTLSATPRPAAGQ